MAQINLLSSNSSNKPNPGQMVLSLGIKLLIGILGLLVLYYVWLFWSSSSTIAKTKDLKSKIVQDQSAVLSDKDRQELVVRQGQIKALNALLQNHVYWSNLFPKLAEATLNSASYVSFSATNDGKGSMVVSVPSYSDLDKFLQVFDLPQFSQNFSDLRITSISRSQKGNNLETKAEMQFKYNGSLITKSASN